MQTKKYLYAAVGAPVVVAKTAQEKVDQLRGKLAERKQSFETEANKQVDEWANEGEQFITKLTESKTIDDITAKVDFDQMQSQVNRLRDQLEDLVDTWRANFKPASETAKKVTVEVEEAPKPAAKKPAAKTTAAKKPAAKKPAAKTTAAKKPAAKKPAAKTTAAKKPAAKKAS